MRPHPLLTMTQRKGSLKGRLIALSSVVAVLLIIFVAYSQVLVERSASESLQSIEDSRELGLLLSQLKSALQHAESRLDQYSVLMDAALRGELLDHLDELKRLSSALAATPALHRVDERARRQPRASESELHATATDRDLAERLNEVVERIDDQVYAFVELTGDARERFPGMSILLDHLLPTNTRFLEAVDVALAESRLSEPSDEQVRVRDLFSQLRYLWAQQISSVRVFVANRTGSFGEPEESMQHNLENRAIYMAQIEKVLTELVEAEAKGWLGLQQSESLASILEASASYEEQFLKARDIYLSENWRKDLPFIRDNLWPAFDHAWRLVYALESDVNLHLGQSVGESNTTVRRISWFMWIFGAMVLLVLALGYAIFEVLVRRPVLQVVSALEAQARGNSVSPDWHSSLREMDLLTQAFSNMQAQVNSRQKRLESIFDNAAEGMLTFDEQGRIESFNAAAQRLFGYPADEVIGTPVDTLVPLGDGAQSAHERLLALSMRGQLGAEMEIFGRRKNGTVFPMSLNLSELKLEGGRLFTAIVDDISERKMMIENLRRLAEHDSLTGLFNRFYFMEELERVVGRAQRGHRERCALLYVDLDNFKYVNDTLGHIAGDRLLVEIATLLRERTRKSDLLARCGGDEFNILLYDVTQQGAVSVAEAYRKHIQAFVFRYEGKVVDVGCSIGVAMCDEGLKSKEDILARADFSCHVAKRAGRNQVHLYSDRDAAQLVSLSTDMGWARRIKDAIDFDRFVLACQPVIDSRTGELWCHEVLLRMRDDDGQLVMPSGFLPAAERFGLMKEVDRWVVRTAIRTLAERRGRSGWIRFSINISASAVADDSVVATIEEELRRHAVQPGMLMFEITENTAIANLENASRLLTRLRALGCMTALDDFGVGYSSFSYLKDLPVDCVKIDGSFVRGLESSPLNRVIIRSIHEVAHTMGKKTVAEFVETAAALTALADLGIDYAQGFHIGEPKLIGTQRTAEARVVNLDERRER